MSDFIDSNDGAGFRHAVALEDRNAEPEEYLCNGRVESCAARDVEVNAVAENRTKLLADLFVKKSRNKRIKPSAAGRFYGQTIFSAEATPTDFDLKAALAMFREYPCKRRFALLGDMLELGDISRAAHEEVGRQAVENKVDYLVTYGEQARRIAVVAAAKGLPTLHADTYAQAAETLLNKMQPGDALLVKASRGMALEKVLEIFYKE